MAGSPERSLSKEQSVVTKKAKEVVLWVGEKSPIVTIPLTGIVYVAGAISGATAALLVGLDVGQHVIFKNARNKDKNQLKQMPQAP